MANINAKAMVTFFLIQFKNIFQSETISLKCVPLDEGHLKYDE